MNLPTMGLIDWLMQLEQALAPGASARASNGYQTTKSVNSTSQEEGSQTTLVGGDSPTPDDEELKFALVQKLTQGELQEGESSLRRKLDIYLLRCLGVIFILNFIDREHICCCSVIGSKIY